MTWDLIQGLVRHLLTTAGGVLVTDGVLNTDQLNQGAGAVCVLIGIAWSAWNKYQHQRQLAESAAK